MNTKRAILFLNLGGPERQADVRPFLMRLFDDPEILRIPVPLLRKLLAWIISTSREKESQKMYQKIGGGSPIRRLTDQQAIATQLALQNKGYETEIHTAFNCSAPLIEDVVEELANRGFKKFLAFPLYPQYSLTTTKGALDRARAAVKKFASSAQLLEMCSWHLHPLFIKAHAELIKQQVQLFSDPTDEKIHLNFSAHSIPEKLVTKMGDPYQQQMEESVQAVLKELNWKGKWTLSWQSKLGPIKWLGPSTEETVMRLGKEGVEKLCVSPIAFVTDHIETLFELDQELAEEAAAVGIKEYKRVPGLNSYPTFIEALTDLAIGQTDFWN